MLLQKHKVEFDGFDRIQEILMRVKLANIRIPAENVKITLHQSIEYEKYRRLYEKHKFLQHRN